MIAYAEDGRVTHTYEGTDDVVKAGDRIRTRQYPGGLLPAPEEWTYGVAAVFPRSAEDLATIDAFNESQGWIAIDPTELVCEVNVPLPYGNSRTGYTYIREVERIA